MRVVVVEDKNPAGEEDKNPAGQIASSASTLDVQELQQLGGVEKTQEPVDAEEPASEGCGAMINKGHVLLSKAEKTHLSVDGEEPHLPLWNEPAPEQRCNTIRTAEACQYWADYALPPRGPTGLHEIHRRRVDLPPELQADPLYGVNSPEWDQILETEHEIHHRSFFAASPPASWFDSDDEHLFDGDDPDVAKTDADLYVRQPGEVGYVPPPADVPMEDAATS